MAAGAVTYLPTTSSPRWIGRRCASRLEARILPRHRRGRVGHGPALLGEAEGRPGEVAAATGARPLCTKEPHRPPEDGLPVPIYDWLRGPLRDWAEDLLSADRLEREGYLRAGPVRALAGPLGGAGSHLRVVGRPDVRGVAGAVGLTAGSDLTIVISTYGTRNGLLTRAIRSATSLPVTAAGPRRPPPALRQVRSRGGGEPAGRCQLGLKIARADLRGGSQAEAAEWMARSLRSDPFTPDGRCACSPTCSATGAGAGGGPLRFIDRSTRKMGKSWVRWRTRIPKFATLENPMMNAIVNTSRHEVGLAERLAQAGSARGGRG